METLKDPSPIVSNKKIIKINKKRILIGVLALTVISTSAFYIYNNVRKQKIYESLNIAFASNKEIEYGAEYNPMDLGKKVSKG